MVRALASHARGQRFKSPTAHHLQGLKSSQKFTKDLYEKFIASRPEGCSKNTFQFYYYMLYPFIGYQLTVEGVNTYLKSLTCGNGKARVHQALKTLLLWLYRSGYTQEKIIDNIPVPRTQKKILPVISKQHLEILSKHCQCERDKVLINFLWYSGVRLSEAANIKASDFNWDEGTVMVLGKGCPAPIRCTTC